MGKGCNRAQRRGEHRCFVHDALLEVPLNGLQNGSIYDRAQHTDGVGSVEFLRRIHVLHERVGDYHDLLCIRADVLEAQVHHAT